MSAQVHDEKRTFFRMSNASGARGWGVLSGWMTLYRKTYSFARVAVRWGAGEFPKITFRQHALEYNHINQGRGDCAHRETTVDICALYPLALQFRRGQGYHMDCKVSL